MAEREAKCLRCGAESAWLETGLTHSVYSPRLRRNLRARVLKAWKLLYPAQGLDVSHGGIADRLVPILRDVHRFLGGRRLPKNPMERGR